jgi:transposase-like protein
MNAHSTKETWDELAYRASEASDCLRDIDHDAENVFRHFVDTVEKALLDTDRFCHDHTRTIMLQYHIDEANTLGKWLIKRIKRFNAEDLRKVTTIVEEVKELLKTLKRSDKITSNDQIADEVNRFLAIARSKRNANNFACARENQT